MFARLRCRKQACLVRSWLSLTDNDSQRVAVTRWRVLQLFLFGSGKQYDAFKLKPISTVKAARLRFEAAFVSRSSEGGGTPKKMSESNAKELQRALWNSCAANEIGREAQAERQTEAVGKQGVLPPSHLFASLASLLLSFFA